MAKLIGRGGVEQKQPRVDRRRQWVGKNLGQRHSNGRTLKFLTRSVIWFFSAE